LKFFSGKTTKKCAETHFLDNSISRGLPQIEQIERIYSISDNRLLVNLRTGSGVDLAIALDEEQTIFNNFHIFAFSHLQFCHLFDYFVICHSDFFFKL